MVSGSNTVIANIMIIEDLMVIYINKKIKKKNKIKLRE